MSCSLAGCRCERAARDERPRDQHTDPWCVLVSRSQDNSHDGLRTAYSESATGFPNKFDAKDGAIGVGLRFAWIAQVANSRRRNKIPSGRTASPTERRRG